MSDPWQYFACGVSLGTVLGIVLTFLGLALYLRPPRKGQP